MFHNLKGLRVLVIDENVSNLLVAATMLSRVGCNVTTGSDGDELLRRVQYECVDVLVMNWSSHGLNGLDLIARVRACPTLSNVPVVIVSAHVFPADRAAAFAAGCDAFVAKPFTREELTTQVSQAVQERRTCR